MFGWLKQQVKNAIMAGINEALVEVMGANQQQPAQQQPEVRLCLPAPAEPGEEEQQPRKARKAS